MAEILPIRPKTLSNQSINQSINQSNNQSNNHHCQTNAIIKIFFFVKGTPTDK